MLDYAHSDIFSFFISRVPRIDNPTRLRDTGMVALSAQRPVDPPSLPLSRSPRPSARRLGGLRFLRC